MSRKIILALTAIAALGIAALVPTSASAFGHFGGGHGMSRASSGHSSSFARSSGAHRSINRTSSTRMINRGPRMASHHNHHNKHHHHVKHHHKHHHHCHHYKHCGHHHVWWKHHRPYWVGTTVVEAAPVAQTAYAAPVARVAKDNCKCLTKTYLEDGSVMFKDICTKEAAVATPEELKAQAEGAPPVSQK